MEKTDQLIKELTRVIVYTNRSNHPEKTIRARKARQNWIGKMSVDEYEAYLEKVRERNNNTSPETIKRMRERALVKNMTEDQRIEKNKKLQEHRKNPEVKKIRAIRKKKYREGNKEKIKLQNQAYVEQNRDEINKRKREQRKCPKNIAKRREYTKEYEILKADEIRERKRKYYLENKERILQRQRDYNQRKKNDRINS